MYSVLYYMFNVFPIKNVKVKKLLCWGLGGGGSGRLPKGGVGRLGLEKWEDSDLRMKGSRSKRSPSSRGREETMAGQGGGHSGEAGGRSWGRQWGGEVVTGPEDRWWDGDTLTPGLTRPHSTRPILGSVHGRQCF